MASNKRKVAALLLMLLLKKKRLLKRKRRYWVHPILQKREKDAEGDYFRLVKDMRSLRQSFFFNTFRMKPELFDGIVTALSISKKFKKMDTNWRKSISPAERLAVTLRYLTTGDSYFQIGCSYRMSKQIVQKIIVETCQAIWDIFHSKYLPFPDKEAWKKIADDFFTIWNYPNCLGAIDGKHCTIQSPAKSGSTFFNYKKSFSIVLLAIVDAHYNFIMIDVGSYGREGDAGVFRKSCFGRALLGGTLDLPAPKELPGTTGPKVPFVFVGDAAFGLHVNMMRPYGGSNQTRENNIYDYRHSRARGRVENAFGILVQRFHVLRSPIRMKPHNADHIIKAICVLHNMLRIEKGVDILGTETNFKWRDVVSNNTLLPLSGIRGRTTTDARIVREHFTNYFNSTAGSVSWQNCQVSLCS